VYPKRVLGMRLGLSCRQIHFLHATAWGTESDGTRIATYVVHYADGGETAIPIVLGRDVCDWWRFPSRPRDAERAVVAWTGTNRWSALRNSSLRLFKSSWENPRPDVEIKTIDYVSALRRAAPFLIAITAEP